MLGSISLSTVPCVQCKTFKRRCDRRKPTCTCCLVKRRPHCWYLESTPPPDLNEGAVEELPRAETTSASQNQIHNTDQAMPVLRELCFVGQRLGALEMFLLKSYQTECSSVMRASMEFILRATSRTPTHDGRTWATSMTPVEAASHATAWGAICFGAVTQKHAGADIFLGNAIEAARLCYDVPCNESLTALIAVAYVAFFLGRSEVLTLFAGYIEIMSADLPIDAVSDVKIRYMSGLINLTTFGKQEIELRTKIFPKVQTPAEDLAMVLFEAVPKALMLMPAPCHLSTQLETLVNDQIQCIEQSLARVMQNRSTGDHSEIHAAITLLFFFYINTGKTGTLISLAKKMVDLYCQHPLMLHTRKRYKFAIGFARCLFRCGEIEAASRIWSYLRNYRPLHAARLGPLHTEIEIGGEAGGSCVTRDAIAEFSRIFR